MIIRDIKTKIIDFLTVTKIEQRNKGIFIGPNVKFQKPQYITFGSNVVVGGVVLFYVQIVLDQNSHIGHLKLK